MHLPKNGYMVKAYCAGILIFEDTVPHEELNDFMSFTKERLKMSELKITFALAQVQIASEVCLDVYEQPTHKYRSDLSKAFKK